MHLFSRAFLAQGNTWIVMLGQLLFFAVTVGGSALTIGDLGVLSFGVFFTLGAFLQVALLIIWFHFRVDRLPIGYFWQKFSRTFFLSILMALVVLLIIQLSQGLKEYIALALAIIGGGAVYLGGAFLLRMPEVERAVKFLTTPGK
jgi:peptidoglycan biosynthesis protein MviN/MurJ (putative lipid II flippase)